MPHPLLAKRYWIFDMDGTLTVAKHDFPAMRTELGLDPNQTILESLAAMSPEQAAPFRARLHEMEFAIAKQSEPAQGAIELLNYLNSQGKIFGILTRNSAANTQVTLQAAGLAPFFPLEHIISRDDAAPKPHPEGIYLLLKRWQGTKEQAVMVGDFHYDLHAGRAAQTTTLYVDPSGAFAYRADADVWVQTLSELLQ